MRNLLVIVAFLFLSVAATGQTFNFEPTSQAAGATYEPPTEEVLAEWWWLNETGQTFDPGDGAERNVYSNNKNGKPVVHLRGKYFVYLSSLESPGTVSYKGKDYPAYPASKPGSYVIFIEGSNGLWGKPVKPAQ